MSDLTAQVNKLDATTINVKGAEALDYNFHYTQNVFDINDSKLADIYKRWQRVLIVMDTSESLLQGMGRAHHTNPQSSTRSTRTRSRPTLTTTTSRSPGRSSRAVRSTRPWT